MINNLTLTHKKVSCTSSCKRLFKFMSGRFSCIIALLMLLQTSPTLAQQEQQTELFCGAELFYGDTNFTRLYNVRINATPGIKVHLGNDWLVAGQIQVPIVNDGYAKRYNMIRLSMANVAKELHFKQTNQHLKITAGLFGQERYGGDVRWMWVANNWLMLQARAGLISHWALGFDFDKNSESEFENDWSTIGILGANVWLNPWNTEFRVSGGRYMNKDYGVEGEILRHFKHCTVSTFLQYHDKYYNNETRVTNHVAGGFRIVMMIPPYKKSNKKVVIRPASNFRLTYNAQSNGYSMKKYSTDPEENERTNAISIPWGTGNFNE